jgi:hypothetical protein
MNNPNVHAPGVSNATETSTTEGWPDSLLPAQGLPLKGKGVEPTVGIEGVQQPRALWPTCFVNTQLRTSAISFDRCMKEATACFQNSTKLTEQIPSRKQKRQQHEELKTKATSFEACNSTINLHDPNPSELQAKTTLEAKCHHFADSRIERKLMIRSVKKTKANRAMRTEIQSACANNSIITEQLLLEQERSRSKLFCKRLLKGSATAEMPLTNLKKLQVPTFDEIEQAPIQTRQHVGVRLWSTDTIQLPGNQNIECNRLGQFRSKLNDRAATDLIATTVSLNVQEHRPAATKLAERRENLVPLAPAPS